MMKKQIVILSALGCIIGFGAYAQSSPPLIFLEIVYDLPGSDTGREWVEIYNYSDDPVVIMTGAGATTWRFFDGSLHTLHLVQGDATITPRGFGIFADNATTWLSEHPSFSGTLFDTSFSLKNTTGTIGMTTASAEPLFEQVTYNALWGGAGTGYTLERTDLDPVSTSAVHWMQGVVSGGTPGYWELIVSTVPPTSTPTTTSATNEPPLLLSPSVTPSSQPVPLAYSHDVIINELLPNPTGADLAGEFIELYNRGIASVDLAGWQVQDDTSTVFTVSEEDFATTDLGPGGYFVIPRTKSHLSLNNAKGDGVKLYWPDDTLTDVSTYEGKAAENKSWSRFEQGWIWAEPSPLGENKYKPQTTNVDDATDIDATDTVPEPFRIVIDESDLAITEVLPNPQGKDTNEWIEIKNTTTSTIDLFGLALDDDAAGSKPYLFPQNTLLKAGEYQVFGQKETKLSLGNTHDQARILDFHGDTIVSVSYDKAPEGQSYSYDEEKNQWFWNMLLNPGSSAHLPSADEPEVAGFTIPLITSMDAFVESMIGDEIQMQGTVIVTPGSMSKQKMYITLADDQAPDSLALLPLYNFHGDFPPVAPGDTVDGIGTVAKEGTGWRIKIVDKAAVVVTGHQKMPLVTPREISEISEDDHAHWVAVRGVIERVNKKSFSMSDGENVLSVVPHGGVVLGLAVLQKGQSVEVTGFLEFTSSKKRLTTMSVDAISIASTTPTSFTLASATTTIENVSRDTNSSEKPWYFLLTIPITLGGGWLFKKYFLPRFVS